MIWGLTTKEREATEKALDLRWFAWRPVQLTDGRFVWWIRLRRVFWVTRGGSSGYDYYLTEDSDDDE